jgi:RepB DNA-primase from phage plasmid
LPAVAFVTLQTSPGNHRAWLALPGSHGREFCSRVRKGAGADTGASGATRIPGSFNFKPDHAPEKTGRPYPRVAIIEAHPQLTTTPAQLERLKLVAPERKLRRSPLPALRASICGNGWITNTTSTAPGRTRPARLGSERRRFCVVHDGRDLRL